ncbi:hypothetical protein GW17_00054046 [Ensete ventricosum]|nr:hypothetical protein GW17_00054046 [Ensete ventricosum]
MTGATKLQLDDGPRSNLGIRLGSDDAVGSLFARRFAEGIGKLAGNTPVDRRKKIEILVARMPEATRLTGVTSWFSLLVIKWFGLHLKKIASGR